MFSQKMYNIAILIVLLSACTSHIHEPSIVELYEFRKDRVYKAHISKGVDMAQHTFAMSLHPVQKKETIPARQASVSTGKDVVQPQKSSICVQKPLGAQLKQRKAAVEHRIAEKTTAPKITEVKNMLNKPVAQKSMPVSYSTDKSGPSVIQTEKKSTIRPLAIEKPARTTLMQAPLVGGKLISEFGASDGLNKNDGVNFKAHLHDDVYAADDGVVLYSGELGGYGKIVIVRHNDNVVTSYSHLHKQCVQEGARVSRGDVIGFVGSTGDVFDPQLHFEVIVNKKNVDPMRYIQ